MMYPHTNEFPNAASHLPVHCPSTSGSVLRAAELISQADGLIITTGAGMGMPSGLPELRDDRTLWQAYPALGYRGLGLADIASPQSFRTDPRLAWGFYGHRLALYRRTRAHAGYAILSRWTRSAAQGSFVYTSNVDEQFQQAGFMAERIHECHGSVHWLQCLEHCSDTVWSAAELTPKIDAERTRWLGELPRCPHCGGLARPNVLMFRDGDWLDGRYDRQFDRMAEWLGQVRRPVVIEIGAGTEIATVRHLSAHLGAHFGARLVRINASNDEVERDIDVGLGQSVLPALHAIDRLIHG